MTVLNALKIIKTLEDSLANLYHWFSVKFDHEADMHQLFSEMSTEEKGHGRLVAYQIRLVRQNPDDFPDVAINLEDVLKRISLIEDILEGQPSIEAEGALRFSLKMETCSAEFHYRGLLGQSNPGLRNLIDSLTTADDKHLNRLRTVMTDRSVKPT